MIEPVPDPHRVLGMAAGAEPAEVRAAWRRAAFLRHPDRGGDADAFRRARAAFEQLRARSAGTGAERPTLVVRLGTRDVARRWWRRRRDRVRAPRVR